MGRVVSTPRATIRRAVPGTALLVVLATTALPVGAATAAPAADASSVAVAPLGITTADTTNVTSTTARIAGTIRTTVAGTGYVFEWGPTAAYGWKSEVSWLTEADKLQRVSAELSALEPARTYHWRIVAGNPLAQVFGEDRSFTTDAEGTDSSAQPQRSEFKREASAGPPEPQLAHSIVASRARGGVRVKARGQKKFMTLSDPAAIPVGSTIDARKGHVVIASAVDAAGTLQTGTFHGGLFRIRQGADGMIDLALKGGSFVRRCRSSRRRATRAFASSLARDVGRRVVRRLWGRDHHGRFRTHGRNSVATVRGTRWLVADRCDGTLTKVREGAVSVRNRATGRVIELKAGQEYLARVRP